MKKLNVLFSGLLFLVFSTSLLAGLEEDAPEPVVDAGIIRFAIISDRTGGHVPGVHGQIAEEIEYLKPDFVVSVGDMIEGYVDDSARIVSEWEEYDSIVSVFSMPYYRTPGNHDVWSDMSADIYRARGYEPFYDFTRNDVHFVVLDMGRWDFGNDLPRKQLDWLTDRLDQNSDARYTMVFMHKPTWYETAAKGKSDTLHAIFSEYKVDAVFTGHYHEYFSQEIEGIKYTSLGSSGGATHKRASAMEYHFAWVTVDDDGIHVAPIRMGSVLPWDESTAHDKMAYDRLKHYGLMVEYAAEVDEDMSVPQQDVTVVLDNRLSSHDIEDSLRWEVPENWQVKPQSMIVRLPSGQKQSYKFNVSSNGELYPLPKVSTSLMFKPGNVIELTNRMRIARKAVCYPVTFEPVIDGNISEAFWREPVTRYYNSDGETAETDSTEFYFTHDDSNLYIAARCFDRKMSELTATATGHDAMLFGDDCIGLFIEPRFDSDTAYQIYFNPLKTAFDQKLSMGEDGWMDYDRNWDGKYDIGVHRDDDFWSIEVRIPVDQFGAKIESGQNWRINFRRKQPRLETSADWQTPIDYNPDSYGLLLIR